MRTLVEIVCSLGRSVIVVSFCIHVSYGKLFKFRRSACCEVGIVP